MQMKIEIHLTPNAAKDEILGRRDDGKFKVKVKSPPVDGAANKRLIAFIARKVGVSKSKVRIINGLKSRNKILEIDCDAKNILHNIESKS